MIGPLELILAFLLDLAIGDPRWLPHPVRMIGKAITHAENSLRAIFRERGEKAAGILLVVLIVIPSALTALTIVTLLKQATAGPLMLISKAVMIYFAGTTIALRELLSSANQVTESVRAGLLADARRNLSMIVGRDTAELSEDGVLRATIETLSENLSDGVIAPVFYIAIGGLPLAIAYKAINTLDSMVGYKNEKYIRFGWASARLDDIANYIPARLSGLLIVIAAFLVCLFREPLNSFRITHHSLRIMLRDGRNHTSPNSGMPEAAMAGALGVRLGGPSTYGGIVVEKPYIGDAVSESYFSAAERTAHIVFAASVLSLAAAVIIMQIKRLLI